MSVLAAGGYVINSGPQATLTLHLPATKLGSGVEMLIWAFSLDETTILSLAGTPPVVATLASGVPSQLTAI